MSVNNSSTFNPLFSRLIALLPISKTAPWLNKPISQVLIPVLTTLSVYLVTGRLINRLANLPHESYFEPQLTLAVLSNIGVINLLLLSALLLFLWKKGSLKSEW